MYNGHHHLFLELFSSGKTETLYLLKITPHSPSPRPLAATILFSDTTILTKYRI